MKKSLGVIVVLLLLQGLSAHLIGLSAWPYQINGPLSLDDRAHAIALSRSGDVFVGGFLNWDFNHSTPFTWVVARLSGAKGTERWRQEFPGGYSDSVAALTVDGTGDLIVAGRFHGRFAIRKLSQFDGTSLWAREIQGSAEDWGDALAVTVDSAGDVFAVGYISDAGTYTDICAVRLSGTDGTEIWRHVIDGPISREDYGYGLAISPLGEVVITGEVWHFTSMLGFHPDSLTVAMSPRNGNESWRHHVEYGAGSTVQTDSVGTVFVTGLRGFGETISTSGTQISAIKLDGGTGTELWSSSIDGDVGWGVGALDSTGNLVTAGARLSRRDGTWEFITGRFLVGSGALHWVRSPFGATTEFQTASAICVDGAGNSVAVGTAVAGENGRDLAVIKHSSSGEETWRRVITGAGQEEDWANACAIDRSGNVIVAGYTTQLASGQDFTVVKLSGLTGKDFEPDALTLLSLLTDDVANLDLPPGIRNSLLAKLHAVSLSLQDHQGANSGSATGPLTALIQEIEAQRGKKITTTDADNLLESVREILSGLVESVEAAPSHL